MQLSFLILPAIIAFIAILFRYRVSGAGKAYKKGLAEYIELDRQSNFARKREIPPELFINTNFAGLPLSEYPTTDDFRTLHALYKRCERASKYKMLKFSHEISNVDLKMKYGAANLDVIAAYEDNYNRYLRSLVNFADELIKRSYYDDAEAMLNESLELGSELTLSFTLLADVYAEQKQFDKLTKLYDRISKDNCVYMENPVLKEKVLAYINSIHE